MNEHREWHLLSAYLDRTLSLEEHKRVESHLAGCSTCRSELQDLSELHDRLLRMPRYQAPAPLLARLKSRQAKPSFVPSFLSRFRLIHPLAWRPIGALALATLLVSLWFVHQGRVRENDIDLEAILAAHARYKSEMLVPTADMTHSNFSALLAAYPNNENE